MAPPFLWLLLVGGATSRASIFQTTVWQHGDAGSVCVRIPSLVAAGNGSLLALAEVRNWLGDHCFPAGVDGASQPNTTALVLRRSGDMGTTWGPTEFVAWGTDFDAVYDRNNQRVASDHAAPRLPLPAALSTSD